MIKQISLQSFATDIIEIPPIIIKKHKNLKNCNITRSVPVESFIGRKPNKQQNTT
jgi:hypothetical protein